LLGTGTTRSRHESDNIISESKKVTAEFNWNSAYEPIDYGCYFNDRTNGANSLTYYTNKSTRNNLVWTPRGVSLYSFATTHNVISAGTTASSGTGDSGHNLGFDTFFKINVDTPSSVAATGWGMNFHSTSNLKIPVSTDKDYTVSMYIKTNQALGFRTYLEVDIYNSDASVKRTLQLNTVDLYSAGGWTRIAGSLTNDLIDIDENLISVKIRIEKNRLNASTCVAGDYLYSTGIMAEESQSLLPYFDGSQTQLYGAKSTWQFGKSYANYSPSVLYFRRPSDSFTGEPIIPDRLTKYLSDGDVTTFVSGYTGKNNRSFSLYDCFMPKRPDAGIVHMKAVPRLLSTYKKDILYKKYSSTRFYSPSQNAKFKYWHSAYYRTYNNSSGFWISSTTPSTTISSTGNLLTADQASAETTAGGWSLGVSSSVARVASSFGDGSYSLEFTRSAFPADAYAITNPRVAVIPGQTYTASALIDGYTSGGQVGLYFWDSAGSIIFGSSGFAPSVSAGTTELRTISTVAPPTAATAALLIRNSVMGSARFDNMGIWAGADAFLDDPSIVNVRGVSNATGLIDDVAPFAVYEGRYTPTATDGKKHLVINSIRFKMQTYKGTGYVRKAKTFYIDVLPPNTSTWVQVYAGSSSANITDDGVFQIWKNSSTGVWGTAEQTPSSLQEFDYNFWESSNTYQLVRGVRLRVTQMENATNSANMPFELIELAPLLTIDITSITKSINITKAFNQTDFGMPFGTMNPDTASITIKNINNVSSDLNFSSNANILGGMAKRGFIVKPYHISTFNGNTDTIPLKPFYCDSVTSNNSLELTLNLSDSLKIFAESKAPNLFVRNKNLSHILTLFFDSMGITNYNLSNLLSNSKYNQNFRYFFSRSDQSAQEALESLCRSAGATVYEDEYGTLRVKSRQEIFGENQKPVAFVTDVSDVILPIDKYESKFQYTASSLSEIASKSTIFSSVSQVSSGVTALVTVGKMAVAATSLGVDTLYKNQNGIKLVKSAGGSPVSTIVVNSGISTSLANKPVGVAHHGRSFTFTVKARTSAVGSARIGITFYDKDKIFLETLSQSTSTALNQNGWTTMTFTATPSSTSTAFFGIWLYGTNFTSTSTEVQFTEMSISSSLLANTLSYNLSTIDAISSGTVKYNPRGIFKKDNLISTQKDIDKKRTLTDSVQTLWTPGHTAVTTPTGALEQQLESSLGSSVLVAPLDINSASIKGIDLSSATTEAEARALTDKSSLPWITLDGQSTNTIVNHQGYVLINGELIRYDGREFLYTIGGISTTTTVRSPEDYQDIRVNADTSINIYPTGRIKIFTRLEQNSYGKWYVAETGRAQFGTTERSHDSDIDTSSWITRGCVPGYQALSPTYKPNISTQQKSMFGESSYFGNLVVDSAKNNGSTPSWSDAILGLVTRDMGSTMQRFGTRLRIADSSKTGATTGIIVGATIRASSDVRGFVFQIKGTAAAGTDDNISFYELVGTSKIPLWQGKLPIYTNVLNTVDNTINSTSSESDKKGIYDLEVVKRDYANKWAFDLHVNGNRIKTVYYKKTSSSKFYNAAGIIVGSRTKVAVENFWAVAGNTSSFDGQENGPMSIDYGFSDLKKFGELSGALDNEYLKTEKYKIFYEEFGSVVRECKFFNTPYTAFPVTKATYIKNNNEKERYAVSNFSSGSFAGQLFVINLSKGLIDIGSGGKDVGIVPLQISGTVLSDLGERTIYLDDIVRSSGRYDLIKKMRSSARKNGKPTSVDITGAFIGSQSHAKDLANFYVDKLSTESIVVSAETFGNPCYQLGDIVVAKFIEQSVSSWGQYVITGITQDFTVGLYTSLTLRKLKEW